MHVIQFRGLALIVAVKKVMGGRLGIVTFLPPDCLFVSNRKAYKRTIRGRQGVGKNAEKYIATASRSKRALIAYEQLEAE